MRDPNEITIRLDRHNYGMIAWYMADGIINQEYVTAPSAIEAIDADETPTPEMEQDQPWVGANNPDWRESFEMPSIDMGFEGEPPLFI